jgi:hypothetical protein
LVGSAPDAAAEVLAAMERTPTKTFAAYDDPQRMIARWTQEQAQRRLVLSRRLALPGRELKDATEALARAERDLADERWRLERWQEGVEATKGPARLRRAGRDRNREATRHVAQFESGVECDVQRVDECRQRLAELEDRVDACRHFEESEGWRRQRLAEVSRNIERHWTNAVVAAARASDPLAYGVDGLHVAINTLQRTARDVAPSIDLGHDRHGATALGRSADDLAVLERAEHARQATLTVAAPPVIRLQRNRAVAYAVPDERQRQVDPGLELGL